MLRHKNKEAINAWKKKENVCSRMLKMWDTTQIYPYISWVIYKKEKGPHAGHCLRREEEDGEIKKERGG